MAAKKTNILNKKTLMLICGVLVISVMILGIKYFALRSHWMSYSDEAQRNIFMFSDRRAEDQAKVVAMGGMYKMNGRELYQNQKEMQSYITTLGTGLKHTIVVVDRNKTILADTVSSEVGKKYNKDTGNEVQATMSDGVTRTFSENGVSQTVIVFKATSGNTIGAIVFSTDTVK